MNAIQKLSRLKQIELALDQASDTDIFLRRELVEERAKILQNVGTPPDLLLDVTNGATWAIEFCAAFPGVAETMVGPWFTMALQVGHDEGRAAGQLDARGMVNADFVAMRNTLAMVCNLLHAKQARANPMRNDETGEVTTLEAVITAVLDRVGAA